MLAFYIKTFFTHLLSLKSCCTTTVCNQEQMKKKIQIFEDAAKGGRIGGPVSGWLWTGSRSDLNLA